jgi:KWG Leptospira.
MQPKYHEIEDFDKEGLARVMLDRKYGYANKHGVEVIPVQYDDLHRFSDGLAAAKTDGKWGYIDKNGREIISFRYDACGDFMNGFATAKVKGLCGIIDKKGNEMLPFIFPLCAALNEQIAWVATMEGGRHQYGFADMVSQELLIYPQFDQVGMQIEDGIVVVISNNKVGFVNFKEKIVIPPKYDSYSSFSEQVAAVRQVKLWGFIDTRGNEVIPFIYSDVKDFKDGKSLVEKNGEQFYIDKTGKRIGK